MDESRIRTLAQVRAVLKGTTPLELTAATDAASRCEWIAAVLRRLHYRFLNREDRGVILQYLRHFSGFSRAQLTKIVRRALTGQALRTPKGGPSNAFARRYTPEDLDALADVEREYRRLSGPATVAVVRRMHQVYGDRRYVRLQHLSSSHLTTCAARPNIVHVTPCAPRPEVIGSLLPLPFDAHQCRTPEPEQSHIARQWARAAAASRCTFGIFLNSLAFVINTIGSRFRPTAHTYI